MNNLDLRDRVVENNRVNREFSKIALQLSPEAIASLKESLTGGLAGSLMGGTVLGLHGALGPKDEEVSRLENIRRRAAMGGLLGGVAGISIPTIKNLLKDRDDISAGTVNPANIVGGFGAGVLKNYPGAAMGATLAAYINSKVKNPAVVKKPASLKHLEPLIESATGGNPIYKTLFNYTTGKPIAPHEPSIMGDIGSKINNLIPSKLVSKIKPTKPFIRNYRLSKSKLGAILALASLGYMAQKSITQE